MLQGHPYQDEEQTSSLAQPSLLSPGRSLRSPLLSCQSPVAFKSNNDLRDLKSPNSGTLNCSETNENDDNEGARAVQQVPCSADEMDDGFASVEMNQPCDNRELAPEICSLAESCCDRRSPCHADDQMSVASWHSYSVQCSHMRMGRNATNSPLLFNPRTRSKPNDDNQEFARSMTPHQPQHHHPIAFNRSTFIPHQPSSLPEQNGSLLDLVPPNSCMLQMQPRHHVHCHQKRITSSESHDHPPPHPQCNSNFPGHDHFHRHHHVHQLHAQPTASLDPILNMERNPIQNVSNNERLQQYKGSPANEGMPSASLMLEQQTKTLLPHTYDKNFMDNNSARMNTAPRCSFSEKSYSRFSSLNPAELCGYTSDTQDSRCCQNGEYICIS